MGKWEALNELDSGFGKVYGTLNKVGPSQVHISQQPHRYPSWENESYKWTSRELLDHHRRPKYNQLQRHVREPVERRHSREQSRKEASVRRCHKERDELHNMYVVIAVFSSVEAPNSQLQRGSRSVQVYILHARIFLELIYYAVSFKIWT